MTCIINTEADKRLRKRLAIALNAWPISIRTFVCPCICLIAMAQAAWPADTDEASFFREKIEPVLKAQCYDCHSSRAEKLQGGLQLDSRAALLRGGESGPAIVRGKSQASLLIQAVRHEGGLAMPYKRPKLPDATIADFVTWVEMESSDPRETSSRTLSELNDARGHWSFQPVAKGSLRNIEPDIGCQSAIDAAIRAKLDERQWQPAPTATPAELIRRLSFDLIGLPPTPDEVEELVNDPAPDATARLVDRLMASPHYGERAAVAWLDVVRFAETEGYEYDRTITDAWRYRDFVIDSMNADKPFDRFLVEQVAGDEIDPKDPECQTASIFHRLGPIRRNAGNPDIALSRNEVLTERTDIIGAAFLGLTVGCARCHNHKLEPISQKDYYRLQAYLAATDEHNIVLATADEQRDWEAKTKRAKDEIDALRKKARTADAQEKMRLEDQIEALEDQLPAPLSTIPAIWNSQDKRTPIHVLRRGIWENKLELVGPRPLSVLVPDNRTELTPDISNPRTHLAQWLASPDHPLTARVIVNRIWQQHLGVGLVKTANDFGVNGDRPSHPELLDWLAAKLVERGFRMKAIHRSIVLSSTYQQSSHCAEAAQKTERDPENRLLWHFPRRRLSAEEIRDAMLSASGRINTELGGPSIIVPVDPELVQLLYKPSQWTVTKDATEHDRRSVYLLAKRNLRLPFLESLDAPALQTSCARRESSTHAPQALELMNGSLSNDLARAFAQRLDSESPGDTDRIVDRAFRLALGRPPFDNERTMALDFLKDQPLHEFALAVFNLNGFLYVP